MSAYRDHTSLGSQSVSVRIFTAVVVLLYLRLSESATNVTEKPAELVAANCSKLESTSCTNCSAYSNCVWCFTQRFCADKSLFNKRGECKEDDWYRGDCDKPMHEQVLLYVLLGCALFFLVIVILLVLYIFCCKLPRENRYKPLETKDIKKRRKRTPLMSKKFDPVGSRTDELKKKYGLE